MLTIKGKVLQVTTENVNGPSGPFTTQSIHFMYPTKFGPKVEAVRVSRDFAQADIPREGEEVELSVVVSTFTFKDGGAGYRLTALDRVKVAGARVAAVS